MATIKNSIYLSEKYQKYFEELAEESGLGKSGAFTMVLAHYKDYREAIEASRVGNQLAELIKRIDEIKEINNV